MAISPTSLRGPIWKGKPLDLALEAQSAITPHKQFINGRPATSRPAPQWTLYQGRWPFYQGRWPFYQGELWRLQGQVRV